MDPYKLSAQFVAYTWITKRNAVNPAEAMQYARDNWTSFLPCADRGLGRLLIRIARPAQKRYAKAASRVCSSHRYLKKAAGT